MENRLPLAGLSAIVTGGSGAIGSESALRLLQDGAAVLITGRQLKLLEQARNRLLEAAPQGQLELFEADANDVGAMKDALARAYAMRRRLDIIVAGVGGGKARPILMHDVETFLSTVTLNLMTAFIAIRYGAPQLTRGGSIVCISSNAAGNVTPWMAPYMAGKGAMEQLARCAAVELGRAGIRVNVVRPGLTRTELGNTSSANSKVVDEVIREVPLGRIGNPGDIAGAVRYLAGPESDWVTGQVISVDGGAELRKNPDLMGPLIDKFGKDSIDDVLSGKEPANRMSG